MKWQQHARAAHRCNRMNETKIFVRDLTVNALLGIFPQEIGHRQRVNVFVEATLSDHRIPADTIESTVSYAPIVEEIHRMSNIQFSLAEKFAEHLADFCFQEARIQKVKIIIEKPDIFPECTVGVEIIRSR